MRQHRIHAAAYDTITGPLERAVLAERRFRLLATLDGQVLEIGAGTGANFPHYRRVSQVTAAEPDPAMRRRLAARAAAAPVPVEVTSDAAESLRHPDASFDAVVFTLVLCSVASPAPERPPAYPRSCLPGYQDDVASAVVVTGGGPIVRLSRGQRTSSPRRTG